MIGRREEAISPARLILLEGGARLRNIVLSGDKSRHGDVTAKAGYLYGRQLKRAAGDAAPQGPGAIPGPATSKEKHTKEVKVKELATAIGTTPANLSNVLNGRGSMSVGRWQIACDKLGLDYDEVVMDYPMPDEPSAGEEAQAPAEEKQGEPDVEPEREEAPGSEADDDLTYDNIILADYALEKLRLDIKKGTDMQPKRLYELMRAIARSGEMTIV